MHLVESSKNLASWILSPCYIFLVLLPSFIVGSLATMETHFTFLITSARDVTTPLIWELARFTSKKTYQRPQ